MDAEIIAIGSELLGSTRLDTNSLYLARELADLGMEVSQKHVVPDDRAVIAQALRASCARSPLVICSGGLGPTEDDCTREAAAEALGCALVRDAEAEARLRARMTRLRRALPANNLRQADRLAPAALLLNERGSAPGQWCATPAGHLVLLPGPPDELRHVFAAGVLPRLRQLVPARALFTRVLSVAGLPESEVDAIAAPIYTQAAQVRTTILASPPGLVELHLRAWDRALAPARERAEALAGRLSVALGEAVYSREQESLAAVVGRALARRAETLAIAESCTGGLLGELLTRIPGASRYFLGGVLCYSNGVKRELLGVRAETLASQGAVSAACACELAEGVRARLQTDWGVSITGIAGPDGGSEEKPVGTVFVGFSHREQPAEAVALFLNGDRERIRWLGAQQALNRLRLRLG